jgi:hypothetical protein
MDNESSNPNQAQLRIPTGAQGLLTQRPPGPVGILNVERYIRVSVQWKYQVLAEAPAKTLGEAMSLATRMLTEMPLELLPELRVSMESDTMIRDIYKVLVQEEDAQKMAFVRSQAEGRIIGGSSIGPEEGPRTASGSRPSRSYDLDSGSPTLGPGNALGIGDPDSIF